MSKNRFTIAAAVLCVTVAIPLIASTVYRRMMTKRPQPQATFAKAVPVDTTQNSVVPQGLLFELRPAGFTPVETTVVAGKYFLMLQNRSGLRDLAFTLARDNEGTVASSNRQQRDWKATVQLAPGTYILREAGHDDWRAVIRVTNP